MQSTSPHETTIILSPPPTVRWMRDVSDHSKKKKKKLFVPCIVKSLCKFILCFYSFLYHPSVIRQSSSLTAHSREGVVHTSPKLRLY